MDRLDEPLDRLRIVCLEARATAVDPIVVPAFAGSTLRGAFAAALKDSVCVVEHRDCASCRLRDACLHPYVFDTERPDDATRLRHIDRVPRPYVLVAPAGAGDVAVGQPLSFEIRLMGRAVENLAPIVAAIFRIGERGLAPTRGRLDVREIDAIVDAAGSRVPVARGNPPRLAADRAGAETRPSRFERPFGDRVTVHFDTPARITFEGRPAREIPFHLLVRNLLRRSSSLLEFHEGIDLDLDFRQVIEDAKGVRVAESHLVKEDRVRYSTRQDRRMNLCGLHGWVTYEGDLAPYRRLLALGEAVGVGKGTTFGLGRMSVSADGRRANG